MEVNAFFQIDLGKKTENRIYSNIDSNWYNS